MSVCTRTSLLACLAVAAAGAGCESSRVARPSETPPATLVAVDAAAMPQDPDPRQPLNDLKEARFRAAIEGLDFESGLVVVTEPLAGQGRDAALAYRAEGLDRLQANRRTGALTSFALAVRADAGFADAYVDLGRTLVTKGKTAYALAAFRTALTLEPDSVEARYHAAETLARLGRHDQAIAEMAAVLDLEPQRADAHERLAIWLYYTGDAGGAWQHVDAARDLGREPPGQFIALLEAKSPRPGSR